MIANRRSLFMLAAGVLACAALGLLLRASRLRGASLRAELAAQRQPAAPEATRKPTVSGETNTAATSAEQRELAERAALLDAARRVPEVARREAALRVIKGIQAVHAAMPPEPRPLPPPTPRDAIYFAELLNHPEYLQLVAEQWRITQGAHSERRLAGLGVPEDVRHKIVELEFDSYTARLDAQRYMRQEASDRAAATTASRELSRENNAAIQQLLGADAFAAYRDPVSAGLVQAQVPVSVLEPLATRVSYSGFPLDPATRTQLVELMQSMRPAGPGVYTLPRTPEFIERARSILQPAQIAALEELRAEYEAARTRSRLPKSSELPRTTRRQRLEAKSQ